MWSVLPRLSVNVADPVQSEFTVYVPLIVLDPTVPLSLNVLEPVEVPLPSAVKLPESANV